MGFLLPDGRLATARLDMREEFETGVVSTGPLTNGSGSASVSVVGDTLSARIVMDGELWMGRGSVPNVSAMTHQLVVQQGKNELARQANDRLAAEVRDLKEGMEMVEEKARFELGMVRPNEILVQIAK